MKKLLLVATIIGGLCACSATSTVEPSHKAPSTIKRDVITCRSGYFIAYDSEGNPYCAPE